MDKMKFESPDMTAQNIDRIAALFPNCVTEASDGHGGIKRAINFELLKQMLSPDVVDGDERYEFTWVGKKAAIVEANKPIRKTLRPCKAESKNWDTTENLYIEGDNLEVLKLLQESYLGKVKMIYIDPPYNTGNDFIYADDFMRSQEEENEQMGMYDEDDNRLFKNTDTNGRFHSDWCSMIYSRLMLARNLLTEDGVIFISIDENEANTLKAICNEVFGENNCVGVISNTNNPKGRSDDKFVATAHEYILLYSKSIGFLTWYGFEPTEEITKRYNKIDSAGRKYREIDLRKTGENDLREDRPNLFYYFYYCEETGDFYPFREDISKTGYIQIKPQREDGKEGNWRWGLETAQEQIEELLPKFMPSRKVWGVMQKDYLEGRSLVKPTSSWTFKDINSERGTEEFIDLGFDKRVFPKPKPLGTIERCIRLCSRNSNDIILDFFSGSASTAHAVMQLNAEDGGHRKFIMVQLPELCDEKSEAYKAGYPNICEIGKERIRRAGRKIKEDAGLTAPADLDIGFRCLRLDESNMKPVYYTPGEVEQWDLFSQVDNVKPDRTPEDLLFQVMLDLGILLSSKIEETTIGGCKVFNVADGFLYACFDNNISDEVVTAIAKEQPYYAVFRDSGMASDSVLTNFDQIFASISPTTVRKVL